METDRNVAVEDFPTQRDDLLAAIENGSLARVIVMQNGQAVAVLTTPLKQADG